MISRVECFGTHGGLSQKSVDTHLTIVEYLRMFTRRIGPDPHADGAATPSLRGCPDILEMETGDFAVIGRDITVEAASKLIAGASCGPDERIVCIPRKTLVFARQEIPERI